MNSGITSAIRPAIGPAIRSAFDGGFAPSLLSQSMALVRKYGGALYNPSNLASLFQDSAGTIPVTAAGQPVGLMLDVQYGLARSADIFTLAGSVVGNGVRTTPSAGVIRITASGPGLVQFSRYAAGNYPQDFNEGLLTLLTASAGATAVTAYLRNIPTSNQGTATLGLRRALGRGNDSNELFWIGFTAAAVGDYIEITVPTIQPVPGNHASQATTTARPTYQIVDGYPCIVGDGVDDRLFADSLSSFLDNTNSWYFSLATKVTGASDWPIMLHQTRSMSPVTRVTCMQGKVSGLVGLERYVAGTANGDSGYASLLPLLNTSRVASYGFSQSLSLARWNNTTGVSRSGSFASVGTTAAPVALFLFGGNVYGSAFVAATPTPAEQLILTRFLASRSGVTL